MLRVLLVLAAPCALAAAGAPAAAVVARAEVPSAATALTAKLLCVYTGRYKTAGHDSFCLVGSAHFCGFMLLTCEMSSAKQALNLHMDVACAQHNARSTVRCRAI
jgi:hypothetical protein